MLCEEWRREQKELQMKCEQELKNRQTTAQEMEVGERTEDTVVSEEPEKPTQVQGHHRRNSDGVFLDSEVSDVLFHFDTIVSELEKATATPRSLTPNDPTMRTPTPNQTASRDLTTPDILIQTTESRRQDGEIAKEVPGKSVQPKFKIQDIKQQFLLNAKRDSAPQLNLRSLDAPSSKEKVRTIIAQMQASSRENSPSSASDCEARESSPVKQGRTRSSSISQRISMLTQVSAETEATERKETPAVLPSKKISELTHGFELKKQSVETSSRPRSAPSRKKRRASSTSKVDEGPKILSPPKSSRRSISSHVNGLPSTEMSIGQEKSLKMKKYTSQEIEEAFGELGSSLSGSKIASTIESETKVLVPTQQVEISHENVGSDVIVPPGVLSPPLSADSEEKSKAAKEELPGKIDNHDDVFANSQTATSSEVLSAPTEQTESTPSHDSHSTHDMSQDSHSMSRDTLSTPGGEDATVRTESTSSCEVLLTPPVDVPYRFRSISDVSHNTRMLTSYRTDSTISASSPKVSITRLPVLLNVLLKFNA